MIDDLLSVLDTPGAFLRNSLAGRNPLQGIATDEERTTGRDLLEAWGFLDPNEEGLDWGDVAGFGVDLIADPLNLLGGLGAWKGAKWLSKARQAGDALPVAAQAADPAADVVQALGRPLHPYQTLRPDNYQVAPPASEILGSLPPEAPPLSAAGLLDEPAAVLPAVEPRAMGSLPTSRPKPKPVAPPEYEMRPYPVEGFYSRLEEAAKALPNTAKGIKAESLRNMLQKAPEGFSAEEWKLYGMDDLVSRGGRIGKDEILHHMAMNRPGLGFKGLHKAQDFSGPDYSQYSPPGFLEGSYVEEGLALPDLRPDIMRGNILDDVYAFQRGSLPRQTIAERLRILRQNPESREQLRRASLGQQYSRWPIGEDVPAPVRTATANAAMYPDSFYISPDFSNHAFQEKNVIGWRRAGTHTNPQGEKVHVAHEFQSDAHQVGQTNPRYGGDVAPLKKEWTDPLIRRHIQEAVSSGSDRVGFTTGDVAAKFSGGELSGQRAFYGTADLEKLTEEGKEVVSTALSAIHEELKFANIMKSRGRDFEHQIKTLTKARDKLQKWLDAGSPLSGKVAEDARAVIATRADGYFSGKGIYGNIPSPDAKIPTAVKKYLKQRGWDTNLERDFIVGPGGEQYPIFSFKITDKMRQDLAQRGQPLFSIGLPLGLGLGAGALATDPLGGDF